MSDEAKRINESAALLDEARGWVIDALNPDDPDGLTNGEVIDCINDLYDGGLEAFVWACEALT